MKLTLGIAGVLLSLMGAVWFLQGINVLPGSYMSGQTLWTVNGAIAIVAGLVISIASSRRGRKEG